MNTNRMSEDMSRLFQMMKIELDKQTATITEKVTNTIMRSIDDKIKPIIEENKCLKMHVETLIIKVRNLEDKYRRNNLILHGIKETENNYQDLFNIIKKIIQNMGITIDTYEISTYHRIGRKQDETRVRPILISFTSYKKKIEILKNKNKMTEQTYITEDFSKETLEIRKSLQEKLKQEKAKGNEAFIRNNRIVIREMPEIGNRKRKPSTSPKVQYGLTHFTGETNIVATPKMNKTDAFAYMRARSSSLTDKSTQQNKV